ncbi:unnamed protein product, partial [Allacma fusca]
YVLPRVASNAPTINRITSNASCKKFSKRDYKIKILDRVWKGVRDSRNK